MNAEKDSLVEFLPSDVEAVVNSELNQAAKYKQQSEPAAILLAGQPEPEKQFFLPC